MACAASAPHQPPARGGARTELAEGLRLPQPPSQVSASPAIYYSFTARRDRKPELVPTPRTLALRAAPAPRALQHLQLLALLQPVAVPRVVLPQAPPILDRVGVQLLQLLGGPEVDLKEPGGECRGCEAAAGRAKGQARDRAMEVRDQDMWIPHPPHPQCSLLSSPGPQGRSLGCRAAVFLLPEQLPVSPTLICASGLASL